MFNFFYQYLFIVISQTYVCAEDLFYNQTVHAESLQNLIIESDEPDINKITSINYDLIEKTFIIDYFEQATVLQVIIQNSIHFKTELATCMCQLFESNQEQYFISCIDGIHIDFRNNKTNQLKYAKKYNVSLFQPNSQQCYEMYVSDLNQINIVCHSKEELIIYQIDLLKQNSLIINQKLNHSKEDCLRKILPFDNSELIIFHNCKEWEIFEMNQQNLTLLIDKKILEESNFDVEINLLTEIEVCQNLIFMIEQNQYQQWQKQNQKFQWQKNFKSSQPIIKLISNSKCQIEAMVTKSNDGDQVEFKKEDSIIQIRDDENNLEIFYTKHYLVLKKQSKVKVIITSFLEQNYELLSSSLKFHQINQQENFIMKYIPELYYQINSHTNQIQFYRFGKFKQYLKINKIYIYDFKIINLFTERDQHFFAKVGVKNENYYNNLIKNQIIEFNINNNCQNIDQYQTTKSFYGLPINHKLEIIHDQNNILYDITDEIDQSELCPHVNFEFVSQIIWARMSDKKIFIFIVDDNLQVLNCKTKQIYCMINIQNKQVFEQQGNIYLFELKQKYYQLLSFYEEECINNTFQFDEEVEDVKQFRSNLMIKLSNEILILDMIINSYQQIEHLYFNYGMPQFYFQLFNLCYVYQYNNKLFIKKPPHKAIHLIEIDVNYEIIHLQIIHRNFFFIGVHKFSSQIIFYFLDEEFIIQSQQFQLGGYQLIQPLKYQASNLNLLLAAKTNQGQKVFLIFNIGTYLELLDLKITGNLNSYLQVQELFYFDKQNRLRLLNLNYYTFKLKFDQKQVNFIDTHSQKFNVYLFSNSSSHLVQAEALVHFLNNCYNIQPLLNTTIFLKIEDENNNNNIKLNVRDYFIGPINQIIIEQDQTYRLKGPFQQKEIEFHQEKMLKISFKVDLENQLPALIQMRCLINDEKSQHNFQYCNFMNNYKNVQITDYFYLETEKLLVLFIQNLHLSQIQVLYYNEVNNYLIKEQVIILNSDESCQINIQKVRKHKHYFFYLLEVCGSRVQYHQYTFQKQNYSAFLIHENFRDIIYVKNSDNYHISFKPYFYSDIYIIQIIKSTSESAKIIKQLNIDVHYFQRLTKNYISENQQQPTIQCFLSSYFVNNTLVTILFLQTERLSFEIEFSYYLENDEYNFRINKIFRNPFPFSYLYVQYYDEQILILRDGYQDNQRYYLYDLRVSYQMYDYIYRFENYQFKLLRFDNTRYFLQQRDYENFMFLEIGYVLEMKNNTQEKILLKAWNQISNASIELILSKKDEKNDDQLSNDVKFIIYILVIMFSLILVFLIRRKKILSYQLQNSVSIDQKI